MCYQYWPGGDNTGIDGEQHGSHTVYTLETKRQDRFIVRKLGITAADVSVTLCHCYVQLSMLSTKPMNWACSVPTCALSVGATVFPLTSQPHKKRKVIIEWSFEVTIRALDSFYSWWAEHNHSKFRNGWRVSDIYADVLQQTSPGLKCTAICIMANFRQALIVQWSIQTCQGQDSVQVVLSGA